MSEGHEVMSDDLLGAVDVGAVVNRYVAAVGAGDRDGFIGVFTDDCEVIDPYPATRYDGVDGVTQWWDTLIAPMTSVNIEIREQYVCGNRVAAVYTTTASPAPGMTVQFSGVDIFTVTAAAKVSSLCAYWDPATISVNEGNGVGNGPTLICHD